jgi:hypothetical protein
MTRARALKHTIRARAAKTGERYTTARRHILRELNQTKGAHGAQGAQGAQSAKGAQGAQGAQGANTKTTKRAISDASVLKKTGKDLAHWFAVLEKFGAVEKGHTASARHLYETHGVDGWYAQGITVSYERERGVRGVNQRCDGAWEVSVSKTVPATTAQLVKAFTDARKRSDWISEADTKLSEALSKGLADKKSKGWVTRADGLARFRYKWDDTIVQLYAYPKPGGKLALTVQHTKLADGDAVERYRAQWKTAFGLLADYFTA